MPLQALGALVQKFASAYLEQRWSWPRRFSPLADFCFLLFDPRSEELDVTELRRLSDELQRHLFGTGDDGGVTLLVFEGPQASVTAFAALDAPAVAAAVADPSKLPPGGRLTRIMATRSSLAPGLPPAPADAAAWEAEPAALDEPSPPALDGADQTVWEGVQGIYFTPREVFYGDVVTYVPGNSTTHLSLVDGAAHLPKDAVTFDKTCIRIAVRLLSQRAKGALIYLPICFDSLVRPAQRQAYADMLATLPMDRRSELAVSVYDTPRDPMFTGLRQVRAALDPYVSAIDLRVSDPGFEIEKLPIGAANSVTFILPEGDAHMRQSALRRFGERLPQYKQRRIWPAVTNVRRQAELEMAVRLKIPFVTGPGICAPLPSPVGGRAIPAPQLPMSQTRWMGHSAGAMTSAPA